jgi:WhiB family transcriptional regulator, redox-sensing transcriptional regulator
VGRSIASLPLLQTTLSTAWQEHGLCRTTDATVFFPPMHFEPKPEREARETKAKAICAACPVQVECLEWALDTEEPFGVWGGHSELDRKHILAARLKAC